MENDYPVKQMRADMKKADPTAKGYVEFADHHMEITGSHIIQNGGAIVFDVDEASEHHMRKRLGEYDTHPSEELMAERRRAANRG